MFSESERSVWGKLLFVGLLLLIIGSSLGLFGALQQLITVQTFGAILFGLSFLMIYTLITYLIYRYDKKQLKAYFRILLLGILIEITLFYSIKILGRFELGIGDFRAGLLVAFLFLALIWFLFLVAYPVIIVIKIIYTRYKNKTL